VPERVEAHAALVDYLFDEGQSAKAEKAARKLLERFPDHIETLDRLGDHLLRARPVEALEFFQRALKNNPLQRSLRSKVGDAHISAARADAGAGRFDTARGHWQSALTFKGEVAGGLLLPRLAALELKAGDSARAEELLQQARGIDGSALLVPYTMLAEACVLKLPPALKKRFEAEVNAIFKAPPTGTDAGALAVLLSTYQYEEVEYHGQKTHVKKALTFLDKSSKSPVTAPQLEAICMALIGLGAADRVIKKHLARGRRDFPQSPIFPYREALYLMSKKPDGRTPYQVRRLLDDADRLARALPKSEENDAMLDDIKDRLAALSVLSPFGPFGGTRMFEQFFETFGDEFGDDDWDDD
jgi:tetratricopeptide (TPR) repeat protein